MVFSSHLFCFYFLPLALLLYYAMPRWGRNLLLTVVSFGFYGWANPAFIPLLVVSTLIDYVAGLVIAGVGLRAPLVMLDKATKRSSTQKAALAVSMSANLLLLGFFKYFNFAAHSYDSLVAAIGLPGLQLDTTLRVVLPVGISFYTFKSMSYAIDVYRGEARPMRNLIDFFCFESMFPDLVAGPIIRFSQVSEQLRGRTHTAEKFARGVAFFALGLGKKVLLANPCGKIADTTFEAGGVLALDAWFGLVSYALQIYFDFSGYSDMAVGLALMLGFVFPKNFDSPYRSESITEFWQRWHVSLSTWLRDYLYIPLGGNRRGPGRTYLNLLAVMLLGGLWHGAAWTFVVWGALHGTILALERAHGKSSFYRALPRSARVAATFLIVLVSWVFFRAANLKHAVGYLASLLGVASVRPGDELVGGVIYQPYYMLTVCVAALLVARAPQAWDWTRRLSWPKALVSAAVFWLALVALSTQSFNPFIYFMF